MLRENKKAQVTLFIILAIVIVVIVALFAYYRPILKERLVEEEFIEEVTLSQDALQVQTLIEECVKTLSITGTYFVGSQGGYTFLPEDYLSTETVDVAYGYVEGKKTLPSLEEIGEQVGFYVLANLPVCTDFTTQFPNLEVTTREPAAEVTINPKEVAVIVTYDVNVKKGEAIEKLKKDYETSVPVSLGSLHAISEGIIDQTIEEPDNVDVSYLLDSGLDVSVYPYEEDILIYSLTDKDSTIGEVPYNFMFAERFKK